MRLFSRSPLDNAVLCLLDESPRHGFAVARELATDEGLAATLRVRRPLVYRAIDDLARAGLVRALREEPGAQGATRTVWGATAAGSRAARAWLDAVVAHPRDARIELLAKFVLRGRRGLGTASLARRQRATFARIAAAQRAERPPAGSGARIVSVWREEALEGMLRALARVERAASRAGAGRGSATRRRQRARRGGRGTKRGVRAA
ncbi:MAG: PadR family transcriptional regulator [Ilumatobacteraceae bacterium]